MPLAQYTATVAQLKKEMGYLTKKQEHDTGRVSPVTLDQVRDAARTRLGMGPKKVSPKPKRFVAKTTGKIAKGFKEYCQGFDTKEVCSTSPGCTWKGGKTNKCVKGHGSVKTAQQVRAKNVARHLGTAFKARRASRASGAGAGAGAQAGGYFW